MNVGYKEPVSAILVYTSNITDEEREHLITAIESE
jgi:hypothetical protein